MPEVPFCTKRVGIDQVIALSIPVVPTTEAVPTETYTGSVPLGVAENQLVGGVSTLVPKLNDPPVGAVLGAELNRLNIDNCATDEPSSPSRPSIPSVPSVPSIPALDLLKD